MDWTATLLDAAGTGPGEGYPLDGASLLPWLIDGADYPEHDLFWRIASQGSLRRGSYKYLRDGRDRAIMGNWPRRFWPKTEFLYDVTVDGREAADLARHHPALMAEFRYAWDRIDGDLIPYPPDHPNVPRPPQRAGSNQAGSNQPAVSQAD